MFDAVNSIEHRHRPGIVQLDSSTKASSEAAAAAAAAGKVLAGLEPKTEAELRGAITDYLAAIPAGEAKVEGIRLGETVGAKVLRARANDGSGAPDAYCPKATPGVYVPTPVTVGSVWPGVKPFAMTSARNSSRRLRFR